MAYIAFRVLNALFTLLELTILIDCIVSWIPQIQDNKFIRVIHDFINPILEPLKRLQDRLVPGLPMDLSPLIALALLNIIKSLVYGSII